MLGAPADAGNKSFTGCAGVVDSCASASSSGRTPHLLAGETDMRFMVLIKADANSEAGVMPDEALLTEMGRFNEELVKAGVMLGGEGLHPSSRGARVRFSGSTREVTDGPFAETRALIAGYWVWQCASLQEAIDWVKRCPNPMPGESEIEIRQIFEADDFGDAMTPDLRAQEDRLREQIERNLPGG
jgi:hypothetical protein